MTPPIPADPALSVVVATWNRARLLPRALASLLAQSFPAWEGLIVDDGSSDDTATAAAPWLSDPRFRYFPRAHAGLSAARNAGIAAARAPWITFLDSDDAYAPNHLMSRMEILAASPDIEILHGGYAVIGPPEAHFVPDVHDPSRLIPLAACVVGGTFVIRADLLRRLGGFPDIPYGMDHALMERARAAGARVAECAEPTYLYHREPGMGMCEEQRGA